MKSYKIPKTTKGRKWVEDNNRKKEQGQQIGNSTNMVDINPTMNFSVLNAPIKRQRFSEWIKKKKKNTSQ